MQHGQSLTVYHRGSLLITPLERRVSYDSCRLSLFLNLSTLRDKLSFPLLLTIRQNSLIINIHYLIILIQILRASNFQFLIIPPINIIQILHSLINTSIINCYKELKFLFKDGNFYLQLKYQISIKSILRQLMLTKAIFRNCSYFASMFPQFGSLDGKFKQKINVIHTSEIDLLVPQSSREELKKKNRIQLFQNSVKNIIVSEKGVNKEKITENCRVEFSPEIQKQQDFVGLASRFLASGYVFSRKEKDPDQVKIECPDFNDKQYVLELVQANLRAKEWTNARGDEADPEFFLKKAEEIAKNHNLKITVFKGKQLIQEGFRLMHAVGRASEKQPIFINLAYNGNPQSTQWTSFVGKGVCFDSGGLNLKPTTGIKQMHMDKHGAASVLSAIESVAKLKLKINLTASMGFVQNFVSSNSYRPLDIIKSRKGIAVQIGNTDAEGRLVLADCMSWTQQKFQVKKLIELSTLTGAIIIALGNKHAGLFSNSDSLSLNFIKAGQQVQELSWRMPVTEYHHELIKSKHADITNSPGKSQASSCQAAAFLQKFVEKDVEWIHLDIAGTSNVGSEATGFGSKALIHYVKNCI